MQKSYGSLLHATKKQVAEMKSEVIDGYLPKRNSFLWQETATLEEDCTQDLCYLTGVQSPSIL